MWLYPLPLFVAGIGWLLVFSTTPPKVIAFALGAMALSVAATTVGARLCEPQPPAN